jgi:hypothetical protein
MTIGLAGIAAPVAVINRFVDDSGANAAAGSPPHTPPMYRPVDALVLSISRTPGPMTGGAKGSRARA